mmetsp:Transcript_17925/g.37715  ORF Transcript_17925/g.37715 Transcript_17925/m.37715 type:complete len:979 (-) Transcript_17925:184-3120(-)
MNQCNSVTPKGTCTLLQCRDNAGNNLNDTDGVGKEGQLSESDRRPCMLIPSWCANGIFKGYGDHLRENFRSNGGNRSRKRQRRNGPHSNLEQLMRNEIRQCDVCARALLWSPSLEHQYFTSAETSSDDTHKSIAESLPKFIERHLPSSSPLPCSFCTVQADENNWCGSLYCSRLCQVQAEKAIKFGSTGSTTSALASLILPPKLFFCQNRFSNPVEQKQNNPKDHSDLIKEVTESSSAIRERFQRICGYSNGNGDPETAVQSFGAEECALLLTTIIACTCPGWISKMMPSILDPKTSGQSIPSLQDMNSDEESLVEEIWVMSRSHWSLCELLHRCNNNANMYHEKQQPSEESQGGSPVASSLQPSSENVFPVHRQFVQLYLDIKRFCLLRVPAPIHPLVYYATKTIISPDALSENERESALDLLKCPWLSPKSTEAKMDDGTIENPIVKQEEEIQSTIFRWRNAAHFAHWVSTPTASSDVESKRIQALLQRSYFAYSPGMFRQQSHSCSPTLALSIPDLPRREDYDKQQSPLDSLSWLALHDIPSGERTVSRLDSLEEDVYSRSTELSRLMGQSFDCSCVRCRYEFSENASSRSFCQNERTKNDTLGFSRCQLKRLGDLAMQQGRYEDASKLYDCIIQKHPHDADVLHARAASYLGMASSLSFVDHGHCQGYFTKAQRMWKDAGSIDECNTHPEIAVHLKKQLVYKTSFFDAEGEDGEDSKLNNIHYTSHLDGKCFVTSSLSPILSPKDCDHVIKTAEVHAAKCNEESGNSGWTTSRHYAVPTTDIPLHELSELHLWFYLLWKDKIRPLLRRQFNLTFPLNSSKNAKTLQRDVFLHDVFVVRYDADRQRYLPPHYDESTHSFIIALNSDFKGGGTFIHSLGQTLAPSAGGMMSFCGGELLHSGDPVIEGVRYIIAAFCYIDLVSKSTKQALSEDKKYNPSQSQQESKLKGLFACNSKSKGNTDSAPETSESFSFGFNI